MSNRIRLVEEYKLKGFTPKAFVEELLGDPGARVVILKRSKKNNMWCLWSGL
jgi:hypothetical protein